MESFKNSQPSALLLFLLHPTIPLLAEEVEGGAEEVEEKVIGECNKSDGPWKMGKKLAEKKGQKRKSHPRVFKRRGAKPHEMTTLFRKERP